VTWPDALARDLVDLEGDRLALIASRLAPAFVSLALVAAVGWPV
jgi:hypothetical protein